MEVSWIWFIPLPFSDFSSGRSFISVLVLFLFPDFVVFCPSWGGVLIDDSCRGSSRVLMMLPERGCLVPCIFLAEGVFFLVELVSYLCISSSLYS